MARGGKNLRGGAFLDESAGLHDGNARGELSDDGEAVGNQDERKREIGLKAREEL
jgi:hypothetical protein